MDMATYLQVEPLIGTKGDDGDDDVVTTTVPEGHYFRIPDPENRSPAIQETLDFAGFDGYITLHPYTGARMGIPVLQVGSLLEQSQAQNGTPNQLLFDFLKELHTENSRHDYSCMTCIMTFVGIFCFFLLIPFIFCLFSWRCHLDEWLLLGVAGAFVYFAHGASKAVSTAQGRLKQFLLRQENAYKKFSNDDNLWSRHPRHHICEFYRLEYRRDPTAANSTKRKCCMNCHTRPDYIFFVRKTRPLQKKVTEMVELSTLSVHLPSLVGSNGNNKAASTSTHLLPNQQQGPIIVDAEDCMNNSGGGTSGQFWQPMGQVPISVDFVNIIQAMPMNQGPWKEFCAEYQDLVALKARMDQVFCTVVRAWIVLACVGSAIWGWHLTVTLWLCTAVGTLLSISILFRKERIFAGWVMMQLKLVSHKHRDDPTHICGIMDVSVILDVKVKYAGNEYLRHLLSFRHFRREPADQVVLHDVPPLRPRIAASLDRLSLWDLLVPSRDFWEQLAEELTKQKAAVGGNHGILEWQRGVAADCL